MAYDINALLAEISTRPEFLDRRVGVDTPGIFGNRPLHVACSWHDIDAVDALLDMDGQQFPKAGSDEGRYR